MVSADGGWLQCRRPRPQARVRLIAFPAAGAGAGSYAAWPDGLPDWVEVRAVSPPGREGRISEPSVSSLHSYAEAVADAVEALGEGPRLAFFGHSMGGLVAFEATRLLRARGAAMPDRLIVSATRAPGCRPQDLAEYRLGDAELVEAVSRRYGGLPQKVVENAELLELVLPALRADLEALQTHTVVPEMPLDVPIDALGGESDGSVPLEDLARWRDETARGFSMQTFEGDHRYVETRRAGVLEVVTRSLAACVREARGAGSRS